MKSRGQSKPTKTRKREEEEGAGEKWSESLIDKLRSYRSLRRHPLPFPFFRREAINLHSSSSYRFRKRPGRDGVRSTCDRDRRKVVGVPLASPGNGHLETRSKSGRVASPSTVEETFRAILAFSPKEFSFLKFSRALGRVSWLIFHREDPAFKYGINGPRELLEGGVLFLLDGRLRRGRTLRGSKETGGRVDGNSNYVCASY